MKRVKNSEVIETENLKLDPKENLHTSIVDTDDVNRLEPKKIEIDMTGAMTSPMNGVLRLGKENKFSIYLQLFDFL